MKKVFLVLTVGILILATMAFSFADGIFGPAKIYSDVTGIPEEQVIIDRQETGNSYGAMAKDAGVYAEFSAAALEAKKAALAGLVLQGKLTQEQADEIVAALADCDGTEQHLFRGVFGGGGGRGQGRGMGSGTCDGTGFAGGIGRNN